MHTTSRIFAGVLLLAAPAAFAQSSATQNVTATARIYAPITLTPINTGLSFGDIIPGPAIGTVVLDPVAGARTRTGGVPTLPVTSSMAVQAARFNVGGTANAAYAVTLPTAAVTLTGPSAATMTATTFTASVGGAATVPATPSPTGNIGATVQTLAVGATLNVGINQVAGDYTGTFALTVTYN